MDTEEWDETPPPAFQPRQANPYKPLVAQPSAEVPVDQSSNDEGPLPAKNDTPPVSLYPPPVIPYSIGVRVLALRFLAGALFDGLMVSGMGWSIAGIVLTIHGLVSLLIAVGLWVFDPRGRVLALVVMLLDAGVGLIALVGGGLSGVMGGSTLASLLGALVLDGLGLWYLGRPQLADRFDFQLARCFIASTKAPGSPSNRGPRFAAAATAGAGARRRPAAARRR
jgi:hypothetical protein